MRTKLLITTSMISSLISGCATPATDTFEYQENEAVVITNETTVNSDFENVWDGLVRQLARGFFVVNNIEKESRLINVSFSTSTPEEYIDCGVTSRTYKRAKMAESIEYNVAENSSYRYGRGMDANGVNAIVGIVNRDTSLEGRMNVYVAPVGNGTNVSVNVRYVLTITTGGQENHVNATNSIVYSQIIPQSSEAISFNTNQPNRNVEGIACFSRGILEQQILEMVGSI